MTAQRYLAILAASGYEATLARRCIRTQGQQATPVGALWHGDGSGGPLLLLRCGMGAKRARQAASWLADAYPLQGLVSFGFAGGLQPGLRTGDAILAQHIQAYEVSSGNLAAALSAPITPTPALFHLAEQAALPPLSTIYRGALLSASAVIADAAEKQRLGQLSNALAVDMEAHSIGQVAIRRQLSFVSLKTVFDTYHDDISLHLMQCTTPTGALKRARLTAVLLRHPALIAHLLQLRRKAGKAGQPLASWLYRFLTLVHNAS